MDDFKFEDGNFWTRWDFSAPLFENFLIIGPPDFSNLNKPACLYEYPHDANLGSTLNLDFIFLNGTMFEKSQISNGQMLDLFSQAISPSDQMLTIRVEGAKPTYTYCLLFRFSPFSRPALKSRKLLDEFTFYRDNDICPSCLFALCFITSHPFHDLYFQLLNSIVQIEASTRINSSNLVKLSFKYGSSNSMSNNWPDTAFDSRKSFLDMLYNTPLPTFSEDLVIQLNMMLSFTWRWKMPSKSEVGMKLATWGSRPLFQWITLPDFLRLYSHILQENYIIVTGKHIEYIVKTVTFFPQLTCPFMWAFSIITILPESQLEILNSPFPYIAGVFKNDKSVRFLKQLTNDSSNYVVIDLDVQKIQWPTGECPKPHKYSHLMDELKVFWDAIAIAKKITKSSSNMSPKHTTTPVMSNDNEDADSFYQISASIIRKVNEVTEEYVNKIKPALITKIDNGKIIGTMLQRMIYTSLFDDDCQEFLERQRTTQMFATMIEKCCKEKTDLERASIEPISESLKTVGTYKNNLILRQKMLERAIKKPDGD